MNLERFARTPDFPRFLTFCRWRLRHRTVSPSSFSLSLLLQSSVVDVGLDRYYTPFQAPQLDGGHARAIFEGSTCSAVQPSFVLSPTCLAFLFPFHSLHSCFPFVISFPPFLAYNTIAISHPFSEQLPKLFVYPFSQLAIRSQLLGK